eukprot:TRINITY_DN54247_c0_g1_i2.p1 TRINITY_DN54247_c0_g1~~TRINITY_DN54247_c0_g1_i2.p1  ORF type:complete len:457 (-),score=37.31 TRINITY_DN54247_c0_g1_i2:826-2160(-)
MSGTQIVSHRPTSAPRCGIVITPRGNIDDDDLERDILDDLEDELVGELEAFRMGLPIALGKKHKPKRVRKPPQNPPPQFQAAQNAQQSSAPAIAAPTANNTEADASPPPALERPHAAAPHSQFSEGESFFGVPQLEVDKLPDWMAQEDENQWVSYRKGNLPILLVCPYGDLTPGSLANRPMSSSEISYIASIDSENIQYAALVISEQLKKRNSGHPHLVSCNLHPTKIDVNQDAPHGYRPGDTQSEKVWKQFWTYIDQAKNAMSQQGGGHVFVLYGHTHDRIELAYGLPRAAYSLEETELDARQDLLNQVTLRGLVGKQEQSSLTDVTRGAFAFGSMIHDLHPTTPSEQMPDPPADYHPGGKIVAVCRAGGLGSDGVTKGQINATQIALPPALREKGDDTGMAISEECWWKLVGFADIMVAWMQHWYADVQPSRRPYSPMPNMP